MAEALPGWYDDPFGHLGLIRYWDGNGWTEYVQPAVGPTEQHAGGTPTVTQRRTDLSGLSIASFVLALFGLGLYCVFPQILVVVSPVAIGLAIPGLWSSRKELSQAALVISGSCLFLLAVLIWMLSQR
jgi:hypothetical protein